MAQRPKKKAHLSIAVYIAGAFVLTVAMSVLITAGTMIIAVSMHRGAAVTDSELIAVFVIASVIALLLSVVLGLYLASGVGQPIQRISKTVSAIKSGDTAARTGLTGQDELSQLGQSIDEMAEAIQRDRDLERQLIGDVAHELRTPLMAIQATVEAIQDGVFEADEEHLDTISSETRRLGRLVEALLHLNRLENGKAEVKFKPVDLSALVDELSITHEALIESSGITFSVDLATNVRVVGDRDLLSQAVANLLSNAVRYTPDGGSILLRLGRKGGYANISVTDTGIGISEEDLEKVFSRFWRADSARATISGGLGIGLALVREVADQHGGSVSVVSKQGEGSTFSINIPLADNDPSRVDPSAERARKRRVARAAKREQDKWRKEQDALRKLKREQARVQRRAEERERRESGSVQQLTLFGIRVPIPTKKDYDDKTKP